MHHVQQRGGGLHTVIVILGRLGLVIVVFALFEGIARLVPEPDGFQTRVRRFSARMITEDERLGHRLVPSREVNVGGIEYRTSSLGTRGGDPTPEAELSSRTRRILVLGDSVAMGWGVEERDSYPSRLETLLKGDGHEIEVINASVLAYGTREQADWLEEIGPRTGPEIVLLGYFPNDPESHESATRLPGPTWLRLWRLAAPHLLGLAVRLGIRPTPEEYYRQLHSRDGPDWPRAATALGRIGAWCQKHGAHCGLQLLPDLTSLPFALDDIHAQVAREGRHHGMKVLDLAPLLKEFEGDPSALWAAPDDPHPNADVHARYAAATHRWLTETGWLTP